MSLKKVVTKLNQMVYPQHLFYGPEWLVLGVNNVCNLHCKMCDVGTGNNNTNFARNLTASKPLHMPLELFKTIATQASNYFPTVKLGYAFTEPLAYTHLMESLNFSASKKLFTSITTNALMLPSKAEDLCKAGLNEINISLDGLENTHNFIRGNKNSFAKAIEGIEALLCQKNPPLISVYSVVTEWNYTELKLFVDYFKKYPLSQLGFMHPNYTPAHIAQLHNSLHGKLYPATESNMDEINLKSINLDVLINQVSLIKQTTWPFKVTFSPNITSKHDIEKFYLKPELLIGKKCNDAFRNIMIKSDGNIIPAHGRCYELVFGNLYDNNLKQIWNSEVAALFRKNLLKAGGLFPACSRCCSAF